MTSAWLAGTLLVILLSITPSAAQIPPAPQIPPLPVQIPPLTAQIPNYVMLPFNPQLTFAQGVDMVLGITSTAPPATSEPPEETTPNAFQLAGWETDDKGNVFVGTDDAKLLLISVGSYWPFPKDYRK
ncbi:unnamed protein product [Haemonchus placei]|uniref:PQQ_3 domain-containing protein n=1 Tax=Haemonchus placei TaxID=6290 RepID=A0A0N4XA72_HAEPC|nr:unnamed protein product [Haemonchus placei]